MSSQKFDITLDEGKKWLNTEMKASTHRRRKVDEKSCVTPADTSNEFDVQNKLGRKHTHTTHIASLVHNNTKEAPLQTQHTTRPRAGSHMESGDNVGGANNYVGGGASLGAAADHSAPCDGAAAAAGGGSVVVNKQQYRGGGW